MKIDTLISMIFMLPKTPAEAMTTEDLVTKYFKLTLEEDPDRPTHNTFMRRQIDDMQKLNMVDYVPKVEEGKRIKRSERYFLKEHSVVQYFMNSKVALSVIWAKNVMKALGPVIGLHDVDKTARAARLNQREKVLTEKIRLVQDGIERKDARIDPLVLANCITAIESNHTVLLRYRDRQGTVVNEIEEDKERTILGLVAKDGTIYGITCLSYEDVPFHIALHRVDEAQESGSRAHVRSDFQIDEYIRNQHQLAHILQGEDSPIHVVLKVAPEAIFHFLERPITSVYGEQLIEEPKGRDKRYTVSITVPFSVQLAPFLWSHAGWIEVVSPPSLRNYVGERILAAAMLYQKNVEPRFGPA